jgi:hypothetical protein
MENTLSNGLPIADSLDECLSIATREFKRERLADELLGDLLLPRLGLALRRLRAQRTLTEDHDACFAAFEWACRDKGWSSLPALPEVVATWLMGLADFGKGADYLAVMTEAISWRHRNAGLGDPVASDVVDALLGDLAVKEKLSETSKPKRPKKAKAKNGD